MSPNPIQAVVTKFGVSDQNLSIHHTSCTARIYHHCSDLFLDVKTFVHENGQKVAISFESCSRSAIFIPTTTNIYTTVTNFWSRSREYCSGEVKDMLQCSGLRESLNKGCKSVLRIAELSTSPASILQHHHNDRDSSELRIFFTSWVYESLYDSRVATP
ncbi:hypothetical protein L218DRAFT_956305 [Marasmius fiardii PR-910]|nr:hypothetical protein L218DRAFT_956305 [Marasmius fiardii PR-910]